jgi:hypothetical protein
MRRLPFARISGPMSILAGQALQLVIGTALTALLALIVYAPARAAVCEDCEGGDGGGGGGGDPISLLVPDAAFQFKGPLGGCLPPDVLNYLQQKITTEITAALRRAGEDNPQPETRAACGAGRQTVAVWFKPVGDYGAQDTGAAREVEVQKVNILTGKETAAIVITATGVKRQVAAKFAENRHLDTAGHPNPDGSIHLTDYEVIFRPAQSSSPGSRRYLITAVDGYFEVPILPDIDFDITTADALWLSGGKVQCDSETEYDIHTGLLDVLQVMTVVLGQYAAPPALFLLEGYLVFTSRDDLPAREGPGCLLAAAIPAEIMIPGHRYIKAGGFWLRVAYKLDMRYTRLDVNAAGITAGGTFAPVPRHPSVEIAGPANPIRFEYQSGQVSAHFKLRTEDLRDVDFVTNPGDDNPSVVWNVPGGATVTHPLICLQTDDTGECVSQGRNWKEATITWDVNPATPIGTVLNRSIGVKVTDKDELSAKASRLVRLQVARDPDLPPICDKHPERPQCDPVH